MVLLGALNSTLRAALISEPKFAALELGLENILINAVAAAYIATERLWSQIAGFPAHEAMTSRALRNVRCRRCRCGGTGGFRMSARRMPSLFRVAMVISPVSEFCAIVLLSSPPERLVPPRAQVQVRIGTLGVGE